MGGRLTGVIVLQFNFGGLREFSVVVCIVLGGWFSLGFLCCLYEGFFVCFLWPVKLLQTKPDLQELSTIEMARSFVFFLTLTAHPNPQ